MRTVKEKIPEYHCQCGQRHDGPRGALGFGAPPMALARAAGTNVGTRCHRERPADLHQRVSISGGAVTAYNAAGTPVNLQLRWAKTDSASLRSRGNSPTSVLPDQHHADRYPDRVGQYRTTFTFNASGALSSPSGSSMSVPNVSVDGQALGTLSVNIASASPDADERAGGDVDRERAERLTVDGHTGNADRRTAGRRQRAVGIEGEGRADVDPRAFECRSRWCWSDRTGSRCPGARSRAKRCRSWPSAIAGSPAFPPNCRRSPRRR